VFSEDELGKILNEDGLLDQVARHLTDAGLQVNSVTPVAPGFDAQWEVAGPGGSERYAVRIKPNVATAIPVPGPAHGHALTVSRYVPEQVGRVWRDLDIHYVDSAGNMYLRSEGLLLDVRGRPRPATPRPADPDRLLRAFRPSGLKVLFTLLAEPDLIAGPFREIASAAGVSLGTVHWIVKELEALGHVHPGPPGRRLVRTRELLDRWAEAYAVNLAPQLALARFDSPDPEWWRDADDALLAEQAEWGGETAAHRLNPELRPGRAVLYSPSLPKRLAIDYRFFRTDGPGTIEVRQRFWHLPEYPASLTTPTPLVYADLIATADPRLLEAAAQLRERDELLRRLDRA
jgi:hypothetical protein